MSEVTRSDRAIGAAWGLALGDALGFPADQHRTVRDPWVRSTLWKAPLELDEAQVLRVVTPFVLNTLEVSQFTPTDDAESFVVAARALIDSSSHDVGPLFNTWISLMNGPDVWCGPAARSAVINAREGMIPPATGNDNPAFYDDTAIPGAVAVGIAYSGRPEEAREVASRFASITHAHDGLVAAQVVASLIAELISGASATDAWQRALAIPDGDSWLGSALLSAHHIVEKHPTYFDALPHLLEAFAPRTYSHPGTAAETLPLAYAISHYADSNLGTALPAALAVARHQDSLPAMVGAICGATVGAAAFGDDWPRRIDSVKGTCVPALAGSSLRELAETLSKM